LLARRLDLFGLIRPRRFPGRPGSGLTGGWGKVPAIPSVIADACVDLLGDPLSRSAPWIASTGANGRCASIPLLTPEAPRSAPRPRRSPRCQDADTTAAPSTNTAAVPARPGVSFIVATTAPLTAGLAVRATPLLFVLIWASGFIVAKDAAGPADPLTFLLLRSGFVVVLIGPPFLSRP
jgi:hypothetical protein